MPLKSHKKVIKCSYTIARVVLRKQPLDVIAKIFAFIFTWAFVFGVAGCLIVIPLVAYRLFSVLFEQDQPGER